MELRDVGAENWRDVVRIEPREEQRRFVASVAYYLNLCHYGGVWRPLGLYLHDEVIGFAMWGVDDTDSSHWIGGLVVGAEHQGKGHGREAMEALLGFLAAQPGCREIALSYEPENKVARRLYASLGFVETGEQEEDELVARRPVGDETKTRGG
jgi:diamine N-acetyltransferase